jgi:6-phosphogluconolactonase
VEKPKILVFEDPDDLSRGAADKVIELARAAILSRRVFHWALAGGNTPRRLYARIAAPEWSCRMPWRETKLYWGDERCVPPDHPQSNFGMAHEELISKAPIPSAHVFRIKGEMLDPGAAAADYESVLRRTFGMAETAAPRFDLVLLGLGADGHTASLFPGTAALEEKDRWVVALDVPVSGVRRVTLTFRALNAAREVLFLVTGKDKAVVVADVLEGRLPGLRPAESVRPADGRVSWFLDREAASLLKGVE